MKDKEDIISEACGICTRSERNPNAWDIVPPFLEALLDIRNALVGIRDTLDDITDELHSPDFPRGR